MANHINNNRLYKEECSQSISVLVTNHMASSKVTQVTLTRHRRRRVFYSGLTFFISILTQLVGTNDQVMDKVVRTKQLDGSSSVNGISLPMQR